jgi:hypothetical protein
LASLCFQFGNIILPPTPWQLLGLVILVTASLYLPLLARSYYKYLSLAFVKTYIVGGTQYHNYLTSSYAQKLSKAPMQLQLLQELPIEQVSKSLKFSCPGRMEK